MTNKKTAPAPGPSPEAEYRVELLRVVATRAFVYRPEDEHRMSGEQIIQLAEAAGAPVDDIARYTPIEN